MFKVSSPHVLNEGKKSEFSFRIPSCNFIESFVLMLIHIPYEMVREVNQSIFKMTQTKSIFGIYDNKILKIKFKYHSKKHDLLIDQHDLLKATVC
ncbi:hypothetical protein E5288_WYG015737 [Bos mutus]|uniref:Uncharacterized protein n=1 Tax=Bos mutus TaxID=72004 RepID=A0A6B0S8T7_9CETA|nr:hypothetical protein [Bos mutus]